METKIINFIGGPAVGKSTSALRIASDLSKAGHLTEYVNEYAKDRVWEDATFEDELYIYAKQHHKIHRVNGKVDFIVTDAPLIMKLHYMPEELDFSNLVLDIDKMYNNKNILLKRSKNTKFYQEGRNHTLEESIEVDEKLEQLLIDNNIEYITINVDEIPLDGLYYYLLGKDFFN